MTTPAGQRSATACLEDIHEAIDRLLDDLELLPASRLRASWPQLRPGLVAMLQVEHDLARVTMPDGDADGLLDPRSPAHRAEVRRLLDALDATCDEATVADLRHLLAASFQAVEGRLGRLPARDSRPR